MKHKLLIILLPFTAALFLVSSCSKTTSPPDDQQYKGWVVGQAESGFGTILSTANDGLNWSRQASESQAAGVDLLDIHGLDKNYVWAVGGIYRSYGLILHSTDGGINWFRQGTENQIGNVKLFAVHAIDQLNIWVAGENGKLINSQDGGLTWNSVTTSSLPPVNFTAITSSGNNNIWVVGNAVDTAAISDTIGLIYHSIDGGTTWNRQGEGLPFPKRFFDVTAGNDSIVYIAAANSVYKTVNGGTTWLKLLSVNNRNIRGICAVDVENVWAVGDRDGIFRTRNGAIMWDTITPALKGFTLNGVTVADINRIWIVGTPATGTGKGTIIYSRNAGDTWFIEDFPVNAGLQRVSFASARR